MTPCYEHLKNLLNVLENAFEVIVKDKNNIFLRKTTKKSRKTGKKHPFIKLLPTCPQGSVGGVFNRPVIRAPGELCFQPKPLWLSNADHRATFLHTVIPL